MVTRKNNLL